MIGHWTLETTFYSGMLGIKSRTCKAHIYTITEIQIIFELNNFWFGKTKMPGFGMYLWCRSLSAAAHCCTVVVSFIRNMQPRRLITQTNFTCDEYNFVNDLFLIYGYLILKF